MNIKQLSIVVGVVFAGLLFAYVVKSRELSSGSVAGTIANSTENVSMEDGKQVVNIEVRGGYWPRITTVKAGVDTVLKMKTNNTYDCSSSLVIPKLGIRKFLQPTGVEVIEMGKQVAGTKIGGACSMGMYAFEVRFI